MKVTEKCDVYSFGVLAIEVISGKHPGESINTLLSQDVSLDSILDRRLPSPEHSIEFELLAIFKMAIVCLSPNPRLRPAMNVISQAFANQVVAPSMAFPLMMEDDESRLIKEE